MVIIETTEDLLKALRENEDFLAAARQEIYTQDLLALPGEFREYSSKTDARLETIEGDIHGLKTDTQEMKGDIHGLKSDVQEMKSDIHGLKTDVQDTKSDIHDVKANVQDMRGFDLERRMTSRLRQQIGTALGLTTVRAVWTARNAAQAAGRARRFERDTEEASEIGTISHAEADRLIDTDMVLSGLKAMPGETVYIAVEASGVIKSHDIERARESADILRRLYDTEATPAVYGFRIEQPQVEEAQADPASNLPEVHVFMEEERA